MLRTGCVVGTIGLATALVWLLSRSPDRAGQQGPAHGAAGERHASTPEHATLAGRDPRDEPGAQSDSVGPRAEGEAHAPGLRGTVVDEAGAPVAAARVRVQAVPDRGHATEAHPLGVAESDAEGRWALLLPEDLAGVRHVSLRAQTEHLCGSQVLVSANGREAPITLRVRPGRTLQVRVAWRDDGSPIAGAAVTVAATETLGCPPDCRGITDSQGRCTFGPLIGNTHVIADAGEGNAGGAVTRITASGEAALTIRLPRPAAAVAVTASSGAADWVGSRPFWTELRAGEHYSAFWLAPTDQVVHRAFAGRPDDRLQFRLHLTDGPPLCWTGPTIDSVSPSGLVSIELPPPRSLRVRLLAAATREPLPGCPFTLAEPARGVSTPVSSNEDGEAAVFLPDGEYRMTVDGLPLPDPVVVGRATGHLEEVAVPRFGRLRGAWSADCALPDDVILRLTGGSVLGDPPPPTRLNTAPPARQVSRPLRGRQWAITVPWAPGTSLRMRPEVGGIAIQGEFSATVGEGEVLLRPSFPIPRTIRIRAVDARGRLICFGFVGLLPGSVASESVGDSATWWRARPRWFRLEPAEPISATFTIKGVPVGGYVAYHIEDPGTILESVPPRAAFDVTQDCGDLNLTFQ